MLDKNKKNQKKYKNKKTQKKYKNKKTKKKLFFYVNGFNLEIDPKMNHLLCRNIHYSYANELCEHFFDSHPLI